MGNLLDRQTANEFVDELIMAVLDENGRYTFVSKEWQKFMGLSSEDTLGRYVTDAVPGSNAPEVPRTGKTVIGKPIVKNGKHAFTTYLPRLDKNGAVIGVFLYVILDGINNAREVLGELNRLTTELEFYKNELSRERGARYDLKNIIGKSEAIAHLKDQIMLAARSTSTVLIEGETGNR